MLFYSMFIRKEIAIAMLLKAIRATITRARTLTQSFLSMIFYLVLFFIFSLLNFRMRGA